MGARRARARRTLRQGEARYESHDVVRDRRGPRLGRGDRRNRRRAGLDDGDYARARGRAHRPRGRAGGRGRGTVHLPQHAAPGAHLQVHAVPGVPRLREGRRGSRAERAERAPGTRRRWARVVRDTRRVLAFARVHRRVQHRARARGPDRGRADRARHGPAPPARGSPGVRGVPGVVPGARRVSAPRVSGGGARADAPLVRGDGGGGGARRARPHVRGEHKHRRF